MRMTMKRTVIDEKTHPTRDVMEMVSSNKGIVNRKIIYFAQQN